MDKIVTTLLGLTRTGKIVGAFHFLYGNSCKWTNSSPNLSFLELLRFSLMLVTHLTQGHYFGVNSLVHSWMQYLQQQATCT